MKLEITRVRNDYRGRYVYKTENNVYSATNKSEGSMLNLEAQDNIDLKKVFILHRITHGKYRFTSHLIINLAFSKFSFDRYDLEIDSNITSLLETDKVMAKSIIKSHLLEIHNKLNSKKKITDAHFRSKTELSKNNSD